MPHPFTLTDNHIIANINGKKCLIDTGSPMTIGNQNLQIAGHDFPCIDSFMGVSLETVAKSVGTDLDYLIGSDVLSSFTVDIDWEQKQIALIKVGEPVPELQGVIVNFETRQNIPIIDIKVNNEEVKAFFDTGAKISYLKQNLIGSAPVLDKVHDFYPGFGEFETELHEMVVTIADKPLKFKCGTLPALLETTLLMFGADGIVGNELFTYFPFVRIDYKNQTMVLK